MAVKIAIFDTRKHKRQDRACGQNGGNIDIAWAKGHYYAFTKKSLRLA